MQSIKAALLAAGMVFVLYIGFNLASLVPFISLLVAGLQPVIEPPFFLLRELGIDFSKSVWLFAVAATAFLLVLAPFAGLLILIIASYFIYRNSNLLKKDEEYPNMDSYFDLLENDNTTARKLAIGMLNDMSQFSKEKIIDRLVEHLSYHKRHGNPVSVYGTIQNPVMPFYYEYGHVINVLQEIGDIRAMKGLKAFDKATDGFLKELVHSALQAISRKSGVFEASLNGDKQRLENLIQQGVDVNLMDDRGRNLIMLAVSKCQSDVVKLLIGQGADCMKEDKEGKNILQLAHSAGCLEAVRLLLEHLELNHIQSADVEKPSNVLPDEQIVYEAICRGKEGHAYITNRRLLLNHRVNSSKSFSLDLQSLKPDNLKRSEWSDNTIILKTDEKAKFKIECEDSLQRERFMLMLKYHTDSVL